MMKMFVSDLDGTILMQGETKVKKKFLEMITELNSENKIFVVASGRSYSALKRFFSHHLLEMYFLCENGALIEYQGKTLYKKEIPKKAVTDLVGTIEKMGNEWVAAGVHTIYTGNHCVEIVKMYKEYDIPVMKVQSLRDIPENILRVSVLHKDVQDRDVVAKSIEVVTGDVRISYQDDVWTDVIQKSVDKGVALQWLAEYKRIHMDDVVVFGDNTNDIEMFRVTPNSYAMEWAPVGVKQQANFVTSCVMETTRDLK